MPSAFSLSACGRSWVLSQADEVWGQALSQRLSLPPLIGRLLSARGLSSVEEAQHFLNPTLRHFLPEPYLLKDMKEAVEYVGAHLLNQTMKLAIFGDYDVDGATSSALLVMFFRHFNIQPRVYIPHRLAEGYGPNEAAFRLLHEEGITTIITVDCGTAAAEPLAVARGLGLQVIVLDHHTAPTVLPPALAIVNPNRQDELPEVQSRLGALAAVGVTFLFIIALNRWLREKGVYAERPEPYLLDLLDLVALGTVCDVVSLQGLNRAFVTQGLKILGEQKNRGLRHLSEIAGLEGRADAYHLGFGLGPRINAGGRVAQGELGVRLLTTDLESEGIELSLKLNALNRERQEIENAVLDHALSLGEAQIHQPCLILAHENWHPGVIGIVAGRLKERFHRPVLITSFDENGIGKGSGRSVSGLHLGNLIQDAHRKGILLGGGGHAMAAGFSVHRETWAQFQTYVWEEVGRILKDREDPPFWIEGVLLPPGVNLDFVEMLEQVGPYGMGNPQPRFAIGPVRIRRVDLLGRDHLRLRAQDEEGQWVEGLAFRSVGTPLGDFLRETKSPMFWGATLKVDTWGGQKRAKIFIEDATLTS